MKQRVFTVLRAALVMSAIAVASFAPGQETTSPGRKPFAGPHAPTERHSLLDEWKSARDMRTPGRPRPVPQATGGTAIVGRASMVINPSNTIAYTRQYLGYENNCDVNMGVPSDWRASTAYLAGDHVRRFGTNYVATSSGTTGVSGPSCGSGIGTASVDGSVNWLCEGTFWTANATYTAGMVTVPNNSFGFMYQAQNSGMTAPTEPGWPTTLGGTVVDNGVTWEAIANPQGGFR
ncbi:MAG TPA: hypothetical protein VEU30_12985, partial [Thermoanaerobaculia bacterium]|nr:hypothetical protein [Thermoanaerobaculia bacterium]